VAFSNGKQIRPFDEAKGPSHLAVRIRGERRMVPIIHVSRETMNQPTGRESNLIRAERRARRKHRMRLRKLRGWR
jgi:hypothetical protein